MLLRLSYLALSGMVAFLHLLPMSSTDKDIEILTLRHQPAVLQRQVDKPRFTQPDRAFPAALLHHIPRPTLRQLHLIVSPDTVLRWHRTLLRRHHARKSRPNQPGRPRTIRSIRTPVPRPAPENPSWGYRRIHAELASRGIAVAPPTVGEILTDHGIEPSPERDRLTWASVLPSHAAAILTADFLEAQPLTGTRRYVLAVLEHATRRVRILGATAHPTAAWTTPMARNLVMDLQDAGARVEYLIRDRDSTFPGAGTPGQRDHRTLDRHRPPRTAGPNTDLPAATSSICPRRLTWMTYSAPTG